MIGRDVAMADGRPNGFTVDLFEYAGVEPEVHGGMLMIDGEMIMQDDQEAMAEDMDDEMAMDEHRITSYNVCYTKLLRSPGPD